MMDEMCIEFITKEMLARRITPVFDEHRMVRSGKEQIRFFLEFMVKYHITPEEHGDLKNANDSETFRKEANRLFGYVKPPLTESRCIEVLKLCNKSIAYAPPQSQELSLAYAERSIVLIKMHKYELCKQDVERALALTCPDNIRARLLIRKIQCLIALGHPKTEDSIEEAHCSMRQLTLQDYLRKRFVEKLDALKMALSENEAPRSAVKMLILSGLHDVTQKLRSRRNPAPYLSDAVTIEHNGKCGSLVANRDIKSGELLVVEEPQSLILPMDKIYTNCFHCLENTWASIPCDYCTTAMYCSKYCKTLSWKNYHDIECAAFSCVSNINPKLSDIYVSSLRFAIGAVKHFGNMEGFRKELSEDGNRKDFQIGALSKCDIFTDNKYKKVLNLTTYTEQHSQEELFVLALHSSFILYYLARRTNLFGNPLKNDLSPLVDNHDIVLFGNLLMKHIQLTRIEGDYVYADCESEGWTRRGFGFLPFSNMMDHCCDPNTSTKHDIIYKHGPLRHTIVRYAKDFIKTGEKISKACEEYAESHKKEDPNIYYRNKYGVPNYF